MKTAEELYQEMTEVFARQTGMEAVAGEAAVRMYALAAQVYGLYAELDWTRKQCFPQTATGEALDKHGFLRGLTRQAATKAEGKLRFSVQVAAGEDLSIPKGTVGLTAGQVAFETVEEVVLSAGSLSVDVLAQAVEAGPSGNTAAGLIRTMSVAPAGIAACMNPAAFTGGREEEEDEAFRARILATYRQLPNGTNAAAYAQQTLAVEGVCAVNVLPKKRGAGNGGRGHYVRRRRTGDGAGRAGPGRVGRTTGDRSGRERNGPGDGDGGPDPLRQTQRRAAAGAGHRPGQGGAAGLV